jgi:preprotein translocase SecE subunit
MADRKKHGTRAQTAVKTREKRVSSTKEELGATPAPARKEKGVPADIEGIKSTPAPTRTEKTVSVSKEGIKSTPAPARTEKSTKVASTVEAKRETAKRLSGKQETKTSSRRDAKAPSTFTRLRNSKTGRFIYDAYYELRYKVNWPTFEEARTMAILVIIISAVLGLLIFGVDTGLNRLFQLITTGK